MNNVSYSTPESELAALSYGMRSCGSPGAVIWAVLSGQGKWTCEGCQTVMCGSEFECVPCRVEKPIEKPKGRDDAPDRNRLPETLQVHGDNQSSIKQVETGKNPTARHMGRTHAVAHPWAITDSIIAKRRLAVFHLNVLGAR